MKIRHLTKEFKIKSKRIGAKPQILHALNDGFEAFLSSFKPGDVKTDYLLPAVVDQIIQDGAAQVKVLESHDKWFGVTYKEDREFVVQSIRNLVETGVYPKTLFSFTERGAFL